MKAIEIMCEAAYRVSPPGRSSLPGIPRDDIIGMRFRPVHAYFEINLDILWQTVEQNLPLLFSELDHILAGHG